MNLFHLITLQHNLMQYVCICVLLIPFAIVARGQERQTITFGYSPEPHLFLFKINELVLGHAFDEIGYNYRQVNYPARRLNLMFNDGSLDGRPTKVSVNDYIKVNESIFTLFTCFYSNDKAIVDDALETINQKQMTVGYVAVNASVEGFLKKHISWKLLRPQNVTGPSGVEQLKAGRFDVLATNSVSLQHTRRMKWIDSIDYHANCNYNAEVIYPYIHKRYADVKAPLEQAIKKITSTDMIDVFVKQATSH